MVLLAVGAYLVQRTDREDVAGPDGHVVEQPEGDILMPLVAGAGQVLDASTLPAGVAFEAFGQVAPGSLMHLATAQVEGNTTHLFIWDDLGQGLQPVSCSGAFGTSSGSSSCGGGGDGGPGLSWGSSSDGIKGSHVVSVDNSPAGAVWTVVETDSGSRVVSNLVAGHGYVEWDDQFGQPVSVMLLDANHDAVWSEQLIGG